MILVSRPKLPLSLVNWTHLVLKRFLMKVSSIRENSSEAFSSAALTSIFSLALREVNTDTAYARFKLLPPA